MPIRHAMKGLSFERIAAHHRSNKRINFVGAMILILSGVALVIAAFAGLFPTTLSLITGCAMILVSIFPYLASVEHRERSEGLASLHDEYFYNDDGKVLSGEDRQQLLNLLAHYYQYHRQNA